MARPVGLLTVALLALGLANPSANGLRAQTSEQMYQRLLQPALRQQQQQSSCSKVSVDCADWSSGSAEERSSLFRPLSVLSQLLPSAVKQSAREP
mmetsp:Transcript_9732/g.18779  ORF Transcript_9732/g.18779 Transcript_9732/m.18779 type:complete len:95 (+) Transcript_9732:762-1046(+)